MKLYFYSLETKLEVTECDAILKDGWLYPTKSAFPVSRSIIMARGNIEKVMFAAHDIPFVVLTEQNMMKAKKIFLDKYIDKKIEIYKRGIAKHERQRKLILEAKE